ncbi:DUF5677 domain-containing protein [Collimonas fungivorans]|uniref:DUF5677 domain-containing protein n=1 Tax=Collimonas fungivorans TaxID=158899 RepID=UPI003FA37EA7
MTFLKDGFLSNDLNDCIDQTRGKFKDWFALVDALNKEIVRSLMNLKSIEGNVQQFAADLLFRRSIQSFQGAILLAERGMISESRTLVRNCVETAITLAAVAKDGTFVSKQLVDAHQKHYLTFANVMIENPDAMKAMAPVTSESLRQVKRSVEEHYPNGKPKDTPLAEIAASVGLSDFYDSIYRAISGDAAHPTINALMRHTLQDSAGEILRLRFEPVTEDLDNTLAIAITSLLLTLKSMYNIFMVPEFKRILEEYLAKWQSIANQTS